MEGDTMINDTIIIDIDTNETNPKRFWANVMDDDEKRHLVDGLILIGTISAVLLTWLIYEYTRPKHIFGKLINMRSYDTMFMFIVSTYLRTIVGLFSRFDPFKQVVYTWFHRCDIFAFLETFFAVFEVEALTHVCIERYVVAKYITNGWKINVGHYRLYSYLCLFFAVLYSVPPLYGVGKYECDFGCVSWTYDMLLPDNGWERYLIFTVFFLRSLKPAAFMMLMLGWAVVLELNFDNVMKKKTDYLITQCVIILTLVNLACWAPIAAIRAHVVLSQLDRVEIFLPPSLAIRCAMSIYEATPIFTTMSFIFMRRQPMPASCQVCQTGIIANVADDTETISKKD